MTVAIYFDDGVGSPVYGHDVGTTKAWSNFTDWVGTLPLDDFEQVVQLVEYGISLPPASVRDQLQKALSESPPKDANVRATAEWVLAAFDRLPPKSTSVLVSSE